MNGYVYDAVVCQVTGPDRIRLDVDLGFGVWLKGREVRLANLQSVTQGSPGWLARTIILQGKVKPGDRVMLQSVKTTSGGFCGILWIGPQTSVCLNTVLETLYALQQELEDGRPPTDGPDPDGDPAAPGRERSPP